MRYRSSDWFSAQEAVFDDELKQARVILVRPGQSKNRKNWTPAALKRAVEEKIFDGAPMYSMHAKQPGAPRDLTQLLSAVERTELDPSGAIAGYVDFLDDNFYMKAKKRPALFGTSIDVFFTGKKSKGSDNLPVWDVEHIIAANSVDWVDNPAAGGGIDRFMQAQESEDETVIEWDKVNLDDLRKNRPDLVTELSRAAESDGGEGTPALSEEQIKKLIADGVTSGLQTAREAWDKEQGEKDETRRQIAERVNSSALPPKTKVRLIGDLERALESYDEAAVDASVKAAQEELKEAGVPGPRVKGMGGDSGGNTFEKPEDVIAAQESASPLHALVLQRSGFTTPATQKES